MAHFEGEPQQMFWGNLQRPTFRLRNSIRTYWEGCVVGKSISVAEKPPVFPRLGSVPSSAVSHFNICQSKSEALWTAATWQHSVNKIRAPQQCPLQADCGEALLQPLFPVLMVHYLWGDVFLAFWWLFLHLWRQLMAPPMYGGVAQTGCFVF